MQEGGLPTPPPPPPPPVPPPPPPPALGLPLSQHGSGLFGMGARRRSRMRNFNWETLPKHSVIGKHNIWTANTPDGEYELDTDHMEELFSQQQQLKALNRQSVRGLPATASAEGPVSILPSKRSMNIGIFLKQFKRPVSDMIEDIKSGSGLGFGSGKLKELCKLLPEEGEVKQLVGFKGSCSALPDADLFMLMLVKIPSYEERLSCLVLKEEFFPIMEEMREFIGTLKAAGNELLDSDNLHSVVRLVLKTGNYMNAGGYAGSAIGFRMASLLKLVDTKANKPGMNLMHYVVMQAQNADVELLKFPEQLPSIQAAARINKSDIEAEFGRQVKKVQDAKADTLKQEDLKLQMEDFLKEAEVCLAEIEADLQELQSVSDSVADYFCEEPSKFKLEECCSIFNSFCDKFMRAMHENKTREVAEVRRRHRDRLHSAAKRRSTATCSSRDKEMDGVALESMLQNFLTNRISRRRSGRPSSTHGSPVSRSPNNGSLSEITSQVNLPAGNQKRRSSFRAQEIGRKEWNSAAELTKDSLHKNARSDSKDNLAKGSIPRDKDIKLSVKEDSSVLTLPASRTPSLSSQGRAFSATIEKEEEDLQDNNEEEAQKLRDASKKVLRFQNSRGSVSSGEYALENQKSPSVSSSIPRQRTFDMDTERYPGDPTNEDLVRLLLSSQPSSKRNLGRRHTLPIKVPKTEGEDDNLWVQPPGVSPNPALRRTSVLPEKESKHFDFTDTAHNFVKPGATDQSSPSAEKKSKASISLTTDQDGAQNQDENSKEASSKHQEQTSENTSKSAWIKTETSGLFFSFFKRLGDMGKVQNSKETVQKDSDSSV